MNLFGVQDGSLVGGGAIAAIAPVPLPGYVTVEYIDKLV